MVGDAERTGSVRIGILGAARIVPNAILSPAKAVHRADVVAIAARDRRRAQSFADRHGVPQVFVDYDALLASPDVDAVYIPLPNGLHGYWTIKALQAGKHVLCEKPFAANAIEAEEMARAARHAGRVLMEALHYRYHPLAQHMHTVVASGILGRIQHIETSVCFPLLNLQDIRYRFNLAGGVTMDAGAYAIDLLRYLADSEPTVVDARAQLISPQVDRYMSAEFAWDDGYTGRIRCSLLSTNLLKISAHVVGDRGDMHAINPIMPQRYHRLTLRTREERQVRQFPHVPTYVYQLEAFVAAILDGAPIVTGPANAVANMRAIDAVYMKAGLRTRYPTSRQEE